LFILPKQYNMSDAFTDCYRSEKEEFDNNKKDKKPAEIYKQVKTLPTMIRNDGKFSIYRIQEQLKNGDWIYSDLCHPTLSEYPPSEGFTASGDCWQQTGIHGVFQINVAKAGLKQAYCDLVDRLNRGSIKESSRFRLVLVEISQKTTVL
jgi:hypothetical protein